MTVTDSHDGAGDPHKLEVMCLFTVTHGRKMTKNVFCIFFFVPSNGRKDLIVFSPNAKIVALNDVQK